MQYMPEPYTGWHDICMLMLSSKWLCIRTSAKHAGALSFCIAVHALGT